MNRLRQKGKMDLSSTKYEVYDSSHNWQFARRICVAFTVHIYIYIYTGCPGRNVPDLGRMFLKLKWTDITQNTYIRSWTVTEIMAREKCGLLAVPPTLPDWRDVLPLRCACPSCSLQPAQGRPCCDCTCKVLGTLRTTATLVRVFMMFNWMALCHSDAN